MGADIHHLEDDNYDNHLFLYLLVGISDLLGCDRKTDQYDVHESPDLDILVSKGLQGSEADTGVVGGHPDLVNNEYYVLVHKKEHLESL